VSAENKAPLRKAIFLDRDGVLNEETGFIRRPEDLHLYEFTGRAICKINASDFLAVVITNQSVVARGLITEENLKAIHHYLETELAKEDARLDAIYYCPHHPEAEDIAYRKDCECRKPKAGMLLQAAADLNIDLAQSYFIGDNERDIVAGKTAGCITVGVATGYGLKGATISPDLFFDNLEEAVDAVIGRTT
jgi:D-glycero-D-manno-heptose 1,7-bisphosphate phosphatase